MDPNGARRVVVRTHGGLGNQLFQVLQGGLLAGAREPRVVHDANYPHGFGLSAAFAGLPAPNMLERSISRLRIPKVLERTGVSGRGIVRLGSTRYADAYFQDVAFYRQFDANSLRDRIGWLRMLLSIRPTSPRGEELFHIRLGDFFSTEDEQLDHLRDRLMALPPGAFIITNRDDLVTKAIQQPEFASKRLSLVPSEGVSPEDALRIMANYATISSNDSTLAFWAACLANRRLIIPNEKLTALFHFLSGHSDGSVTGMS